MTPQAMPPAPAALPLRPEECLEVTRGVLTLLAVSIKGDSATADEVEKVNPALTAVLNKHGGNIPFMAEITLAVVLFNTGKTMRARGKEKRAWKGGEVREAGDSRRDRTQGFGEVPVDAPISPPPEY